MGFFSLLFLILTLSVGPGVGTTSLIDPECPSIIDAPHIFAPALNAKPSSSQTNAPHRADRPLSDT